MPRLPIAFLPLLSVGIVGQHREPIEFTPSDAPAVAAERWTIEVPERRANPDARTLKLRFVRFAAANAADAGERRTPVVYLAGGPGGSGIGAARGRRFRLFDALRRERDAIAFDQRGTGTSDGPGGHTSTVTFPADEPGTRERWARLHRLALAEAVAAWRERGVDPLGYTTAESARDLDAVREALGVERLHLLGISYGTHLALAYASMFPQRVDRLVLVSPEALDETVKLPARTDAFFARLQQAIDRVPAAKARYPAVAARLRAALERVERDRPRFELRSRTGRQYARTLGRFDMQLIAGYSISDPDRTADLLAAIERAAEGDFAWFGRWLGWISGPTIALRGMPELMDVASGISDARRELVERQRQTALLGDALNFPMPHLSGVVDGLDLGPGFRAPCTIDRPARLYSGTLDGRTYRESHDELAARLPRCTRVIVENGGHNLFFAHPDIVPDITSFLAGEAPAERRLTAELPHFGTR